MDWVTTLNVAGPALGLIVGGLFGRRKTKADSHSVVIADATKLAQETDRRLEVAIRRIDSLEDRERARDNLARQHLRWDWRMIRHLADKGIEVEDPPALFLYEDDPTKGH